MGIATISDPVRAVLLAAKYYVGTEEKGYRNRGTFIDAWNLRVIKDPKWALGAAWCSTFVLNAGREGLGAAWPIPLEPAYSDVDKVVAWAQANDCFHKEGPHLGDLFVVRKAGGTEWGHIGFVSGFTVEGGIETIEGNTNKAGSREGTSVLERVRGNLLALDFVRWLAKVT